MARSDPRTDSRSAAAQPAAGPDAPGRERLLFLLKSRGPQTAPEAAAALGFTPQAAQQAFAALAEDGLVEPRDRKGPGRGRPRREWSLTAAGHARFPDRHGELTVELIAAAEAIFGREGLEAMIRSREAASAAAYREAMRARRSLRGRVEALAQARSREGYMARVEPDPDAPGGFLLIEDHCPICAAATRCQGFCRSELAVFREVLGAEVERMEHVPSGARRCVYKVRG